MRFVPFPAGLRCGASPALVLAGLLFHTTTNALTFAGGISATSVSGPNVYVPLPDPAGTTGAVLSSGSCARAGGQGWLNAATGALAITMHAEGSPFPGCVASSDGHGTVTFSDDYRVESSTLPPGTLVEVSICLKAALHQGSVFSCGGSVYEGVNKSATVDATLVGASQVRTVHGGHNERWNCYDTHDLNLTGFLATGHGDTTLTLTQVPVGTTVTFSATVSASTTITSFTYGAGTHLETALVFGSITPPGVRLVSTATSQPMTPSAGCSDSALVAWLPPPPSGVLDAPPARPAAGAPELFAPAPNPARGALHLAYRLPSGDDLDLALFDLAGARLATLAHGRAVAGVTTVDWNVRRDSGEALRPGLYWIRLQTSRGRAVRALVVR